MLSAQAGDILLEAFKYFWNGFDVPCLDAKSLI